MSEDEQNEQTAEDSEQSDEQPVGSEPAQESEATEQPEEQSDTEPGEKPADESEQATEQPDQSTDETAKGELNPKRQSMLDLIDKWMPTSLNNPRVPEGETLDLMATAGWTTARGQQSKQEKDAGGHPVTSCGDILAAM